MTAILGAEANDDPRGPHALDTRSVPCSFPTPAQGTDIFDSQPAACHRCRHPASCELCKLQLCPCSISISARIKAVALATRMVDGPTDERGKAA